MNELYREREHHAQGCKLYYPNCSCLTCAGDDHAKPARSRCCIRRNRPCKAMEPCDRYKQEAQHGNDL